MVIARGCGEGSRKLFNGNRVSVLPDEKISRDQLHNNVNVLLNCTLKNVII